MQSFVSFLVAMILAFVACFPTVAESCTGFFVQAEDGGTAYARSLEFAADLQSKIAVIPRGTRYAAQLPDGGKGLEWSVKYGIVGMNIFGKPLVLDGFNEQGLQVGMYYFPGFAEYAPYSKHDAKRSLAPAEFGTWLLSSFATVEEVRQNVGKVRVVPTVLKELGIAPPLHTLVVDAKGDCIAIEPIGGKLVVTDNPVHAFTNSPPFDWHLTNLRQYLHLTTKDSKPIRLGGLEVSEIGVGSGMLGLPGDITPPSRFVRAAYYANMLPKPPTTEKGVAMLMRLMNYFFITKGMVLEKGKPSEEYTQWLVFSDLKNRKLYFSTYDNLDVRMVDFGKLKFDSGPVRQIDINQPQSFRDVSGKAGE